MEDFVYFNLGKKLKEKGFSCEYPFAMYNEDGDFFPLYSSDKYYYGIEDFDKHDYIAPTISQVLKWLREKYSIHISTKPYHCDDGIMWFYEIRKFNKHIIFVAANKTGFIKEEQAAIEGISYVLDNLI